MKRFIIVVSLTSAGNVFVHAFCVEEKECCVILCSLVFFNVSNNMYMYVHVAVTASAQVMPITIMPKLFLDNKCRWICSRTKPITKRDEAVLGNVSCKHFPNEI